MQGAVKWGGGQSRGPLALLMREKPRGVVVVGVINLVFLIVAYL